MRNEHAMLRRAAIAAVSAGMALGAVPMAFAEGHTGSVTINHAEKGGNTATKFKGYQIFTADVIDGKDGKSMTKIDWAGSSADDKASVKNAVISGINEYCQNTDGMSGKVLTDAATAQDAADFISANVTTKGATAISPSNELPHYIAKKLTADNSGVPSTTSFDSGTKQDLDQGYWLFVADSVPTKDSGDTGTAPILAMVGGSEVAVTEKSTPVTFNKQVKEGDTWGEAADSEKGEAVDYRLVGTLPSNYDAFDTYKYEFSDTLPDGLDLDANSVQVKLYGSQADIGDDSKEGTDIKTSGTVTAQQHKLVVSFKDLKKVADVNKDSVIVVSYTASLNGSAKIGTAEGNVNGATLTYSNDPVKGGEGTTSSDAKDYTYKLHLVKVDRNTEVALKDAKFTIKSGDKYVQADGSLGATAYEFTTDANGALNVERLDAGTYSVTETAAPAGYDKVDDFTFTISADYTDAAGPKLQCTVNGTAGQVVAGTTDGQKGDNALVSTGEDAAATGTGIVTVTVGDAKRVTLPLTGSDAALTAVVGGGAIVLVGVVMKRRQKMAAGNDKRD